MCMKNIHAIHDEAMRGILKVGCGSWRNNTVIPYKTFTVDQAEENLLGNLIKIHRKCQVAWWTLKVEVGSTGEVPCTMMVGFVRFVFQKICGEQKMEPYQDMILEFGSLQHIWILSYCALTKSIKTFWARIFVIPCKRNTKIWAHYIFCFQRDFWENSDSKLSVSVI